MPAMASDMVAFDGEPDRNRRAILALWMLPGVGTRIVAALRRVTCDRLGDLLDAPVSDWASSVPLSDAAWSLLRLLPSEGPLSALAEICEERMARAGMSACFAGDSAYPDRLSAFSASPPVLFFYGRPLQRPRQRSLAMVGSRKPENGFLEHAYALARAAAGRDTRIVSGAAVGVDQACHAGALDEGAETWAFLGGALDCLDPAQAKLLPQFLERGGVFFSEFPPGVRSHRRHFPRRNRLISGSSEAVWVLYAAEQSGALLTAHAAVAQKRPLFGLVDANGAASSPGVQALLDMQAAAPCRGPAELWAAVDASKPLPERAAPRTGRSGAGQPGTQVLATLSQTGRAALGVLDGGARGYDDLLAQLGCSSAELTAALFELQMLGLCVERPGRRYERV